MEIVFAPAVISLKDPTIRTVLRRLEDKGYVTHSVVSGTFIYRATDSAEAAASAVQGIVDGYCGGSLERVLRGLVASRLSSEKSNASTPPLERDREQPYMEAPALKLEAAATGGMDEGFRTDSRERNFSRSDSITRKRGAPRGRASHVIACRRRPTQ